MAPHSADTRRYLGLSQEPAGASILLGPYDTVSVVERCVPEPPTRTYIVGTGQVVDIVSPVAMTAKYVEWHRALQQCLPDSSTILSPALDELAEMQSINAERPTMLGGVIAAVATVIVIVYRAPVIAAKAVIAVLGTFVVALAATALAGTGEVCWLVPFVCFPIGVGLGMDFHVFFLDRVATQDQAGLVGAISSTQRVIVGAGVILIISFVGLSAVPIMLTQQISVFLIATVAVDTFVMRSAVIPAAMLLLGKYNWIGASACRISKPDRIYGCAAEI